MRSSRDPSAGLGVRRTRIRKSRTSERRFSHLGITSKCIRGTGLPRSSESKEPRILFWGSGKYPAGMVAIPNGQSSFRTTQLPFRTTQLSFRTDVRNLLHGPSYGDTPGRMLCSSLREEISPFSRMTVVGGDSCNLLELSAAKLRRIRGSHHISGKAGIVVRPPVACPWQTTQESGLP